MGPDLRDLEDDAFKVARAEADFPGEAYNLGRWVVGSDSILRRKMYFLTPRLMCFTIRIGCLLAGPCRLPLTNSDKAIAWLVAVP